MAFRSELDAIRERAEGAEVENRRLEATLAEERARIERITEVEHQLETAQRELREGNRSPYRRAREMLIGIGVGVAVGGAATLMWSNARIAEVRDSTTVADARRAADYRALDDAADDARHRTALVETERDDARAAHELTTDEFRDIVSAVAGLQLAGARVLPTLAAAPPDAMDTRISLGAVTAVRGPAPVGVGALCELVALPGEEACAGRVRCESETVYDVGCGRGGRRRLRTFGTHIEVQSADRSWAVTIDVGADRREVLGFGAVSGPPSAP